MKGNVVLSENITEFTCYMKYEDNLITIKLVIEKSNFEFELQSEIFIQIPNRFKYFNENDGDTMKLSRYVNHNLVQHCFSFICCIISFNIGIVFLNTTTYSLKTNVKNK